MSHSGKWRAGGWRAPLLAAVLGVSSALALPPFHVLPLLPVAICGLLALLGAQRGWRGAARIGFCFGFGHHLLGLYWITDAIMLEAARFWWLVPVAVPLLAAALAAFVAATCALARLARPGWPRAVTLAGGWVLADLLRSVAFTGFPWNPLGSVWALPGAAGDVLLQPAALLGVHGLTLATVLLCATPLLGRRAWLAGAAALLAWGGFGLWRLDRATEPNLPLSVVVAQGDIAEGQKWDRTRAVASFEAYLDLTREGAAAARAATPGVPVVVVWPETASPFLLDADARARAAIAEAVGSGGTVLAGSIRFDARQQPRNSLMAMRTAGPPLAVYDKWHLVPFGEYQPSWARVGVQLVQGDGLTPGPGPRTLHVAGLPPFGALICYEAIFPAWIVDEADRPDWLVNITNDAWFGDSSGPRQHLAAARMRAVEEGLPLFRAANTGISADFDAFGRELGRLPIGAKGVLLRPLPGRLPPTLASRLGLLGPGLAALAMALLGICHGQGVPRLLRQKAKVSQES